MLARRYGVHRTARALPMDYKLLRQRVAAVTKPAKFVEVVVRTAATTTPAPECVMEWEGSGGRLRLELKAMPVDEIARLARALTAA